MAEVAAMAETAATDGSEGVRQVGAEAGPLSGGPAGLCTDEGADERDAGGF